jgi:hypothetical protein
MKDALTDLWDDLRAKRLLPVAALLLLAVVAVPVVLMKKSEKPAPAPATTTASKPKQPDPLAKVTVSESTDTGSSLSAFDPSNPFLPPSGTIKDESQASSTSTPSSPAPSGSTSSGGGSTSSGGTNESGGGTQSGGGTETGGGNQTGGGQTTTTNYTYVIDATFTANGRKRAIHGMKKLDVLPSQSDPLLIFMGVTDDAGNAVFLVDATLQTTGEGKCKPSPSQCAFLYLGPGSEQQFTTANGDSYSLVVDQIRKVKVGAKASAAKRPKTSKTASAAVGGKQTPRRFVVPILADLVSVSSGAVSHSNSDGDRR